MDHKAPVMPGLPKLRRRPEPASKPDALRACKAAVCEELERACVEQFGPTLRAIVLTGSLAREEATFTRDEDGMSLLGDAEFLLIFHESVPLPPSQSLDLLRQTVEGQLQRRGLRCHISLSNVHAIFLRRLKPHIFAYELRVCGQVIWGDPEVLSLIPRFTSREIPLEDAWRLLCNRMIEQLEVAAELGGRSETLPPAARYRTVKLFLDMATSCLVFLGAYEPSYRGRMERLRELTARTAPGDGLPFPLGPFAEHVRACTRIKLNETGLGATRNLGFAFWEEAIGYAQQLWRWELVRMTGSNKQAENRKLMENWMQLQPASHGVRGWLYVLRAQGWLRSWRHWLRWGRRAWTAAPRDWIYAAASELFFLLPRLTNPAEKKAQADLDWERLRGYLPVVREPEGKDGGSAWQQMAADIAANYHAFLVGTRS